jgi:C-terminal processing protease CtpA/Prc
MVARPEGTFERYMTQMMSAPIVGALAGNVLSCFEFVLGDATVSIAQKKQGDTHELDGLGLALQPHDDGRFTVLGVCDAADESVTRLVHAGDVLLAVDGRETTGLLTHDLYELLAGPAGESRSLQLGREGAELTVEVATAAILSD